MVIRLAGLRPRHDQLKLFLTAVAVASLFATFIILVAFKYGGRPDPPRASLVHTSTAEYIWASAVFVFIVYQLLGLMIGAKKTDDLTSKALRAVGGLGNRVKLGLRRGACCRHAGCDPEGLCHQPPTHGTIRTAGPTFILRPFPLP